MAQYVEVNGQSIEFPDGMAAPEIEAAIKKNYMSIAPAKPAAVEAGGVLNDIPRQIGLTARYGLEGLANMAQVGTEPIRYFTDRALGLTGKTKPLGAMATDLADSIGLPAPRTANERVIGDATRMVAGTGGGAGLAQFAANQIPRAVAAAAQQAPGILSLGQSTAQGLAANVPAQLGSAAGAGLAGGASREAGGGEGQQLLASVVGGVGGGMVPGGAGRVVDAGKRLFASKPTDAQIDMRLTAMLADSNIDLSALPQSAQRSMRVEMRRAMEAGKEVNPAAMARLADFRTVGATPTRGSVTLDPVQITREKNLSKIAANSSDGSLSGLPLLENRNNNRLIEVLNEAGASRGDPFAAGEQALGAIRGRDAAEAARVSGLYNAARSGPGGDIPLQTKPFVDNIYNSLARENKLAYLPDDIAATLNTISQGQVTRNGQTFQVPFNANTLDNLLTDIATAQRSTQDGNVKAALTIARRALDQTPVTPVKTEFGGSQLVTDAGAAYLRGQDAAAGTFLDSLNQAREAARQRFAWQESSRPVEAALNGAQPDRFINQFVVRGTVDDATAFAREAGVEPAKNAILAHLKERALNGAADEVGKFSQSAFNKALREIGERKLAVFFTPEEIARLNATGRVASYLQAQPVGSAVNNSNSGALLAGRGYDFLRGVAGKIPFGQAAVVDPLRNIDIAISQRQAQNFAPGLLSDPAKRPILPSLLLPGVAVGGGLLAP